MELATVGEVPGRFEDRVIALPNGRWASATTSRLTLWSETTVLSEIEAPVPPLPGPLVWLPRLAGIGWGPAVVALDGTEVSSPRFGGLSSDGVVAAVVADLGSEAARYFELVSGASNDDGTAASVVLRRRDVRAVAGRVAEAPGPAARLAVVETPALPDQAPVARWAEDRPAPPRTLSWGSGPLAVNDLTGVGIVDPTNGALREVVVDASDVTLLAPSPGGRLALGRRSGEVIVTEAHQTPVASWPAHDDSVVAAGWSAEGGDLVTGDATGQIRWWTLTDDCPPVVQAETSVAGPILAVAPFSPGRLVVKEGGPGGRLVLLG